MAYLKERKGKWYACWKENGKLMVKATGLPVKNAATKKAAQQMADALADAAKGAVTLDRAIDSIRLAAERAGVGSRMPTVKEYLDNYEPYSRGQSAISNYKRARRLFYDCLGTHVTTRLDALSPNLCRKFAEEQLQRVSFATVDSYISYIQSAFNNAKRDGLIRVSPFDNIILGRLYKSNEPRAVERLPFTPQEMNIILTRFPSPFRELSTISFLSGGQRIGDCCTLRWDAVDFEHNRIAFRTMKTGRNIVTPMHPYLRTLLLHLRAQASEREEYVLPELAHTYQRSSGYVSTRFSALLQAHGIVVPTTTPNARTGRRNVSQKSFHSIRHTVVSLMRASTLFTADVTRDFVGHESEQIERGYFTGADSTKLLAQRFLLEQSGIIIDEEKAPTDITP